SDALAGSRRPEVLIARARMFLLTNRIDLAAFLARPDDPAVLSIVSRYLEINPDDLARRVPNQALGQASVSIAAEQLRKNVSEHSKGKSQKYIQNEQAAIEQGLRWHNATVLFNLIA